MFAQDISAARASATSRTDVAAQLHMRTKWLMLVCIILSCRFTSLDIAADASADGSSLASTAAARPVCGLIDWNEKCIRAELQSHASNPQTSSSAPRGRLRTLHHSDDADTAHRRAAGLAHGLTVRPEDHASNLQTSSSVPSDILKRPEGTLENTAP